MPGSSSRRALPLAAAGLALLLAGCDNKSIENLIVPGVNPGFAVTRLVADIPAFGAPTIDSDLLNPWGVAFGTTGNLWVANTGSGTATVYDAVGVKQSLTVRIPTPTTLTGGHPTAVVGNTTANFVMPNGDPAQFIFAGEDGAISAWNPALADALLVANRSSVGAVYTGAAIAVDNGAHRLYAADFRNARIDVFDDDFTFLRSFTDPNMPPGFSPFGVSTIGGQLYVTFAKQAAPPSTDDEPGTGNGFVDIFNPDGSIVSRFVSRGSLNSPWAVVAAPIGFGSLGGAILIGNSGDGRIGAYNRGTGAFVGFVNDAGESPIRIDGLRGLTFGPSGSTALYFASGPNDGTHGLVGTITPR